jgi:hypothetical protein
MRNKMLKDRIPDEARMVKRYRRSDADAKQELISEIRPPSVCLVSNFNKCSEFALIDLRKQ